MSKKVYVWTLGNNDRPASDENIKELEKYLETKLPDVTHVVYDHTLNLAAVIDEGGSEYQED